MVYSKLPSKDDLVKKTCSSCKGAGIHRAYGVSDVGMICYECNGRGYVIKRIANQIYFFAGIVPTKTKDGKSLYDITRSKKLVRLDGVNYVIYGIQGWPKSDELKMKEVPSESIVTYDEFLEGIKPLPIESMTCPAVITENYGKETFDNDCCVFPSKCPKEDKQECWNKFYGNATTPTGKKIVLQRKINKQNISK